ncbi:MAG: response regulator [Myxococcales bacterium]|nr:response regulator [Myxococcales bacterium]
MRAFIVDDSATGRVAIARALSFDEGLHVVGTATSGEEAVARIPLVRPDVVLMDVVMGGMSGLHATRLLMQTHPVPIVLVSEAAPEHAHTPFHGLDAGALELLRKPTLADMRQPETLRRFCRRIRTLSEVRVVTRHRPVQPSAATGTSSSRATPLLCVGASTGGPVAVRDLLGALGPDSGWGVAIVQHISRGFEEGLARWLADATGLHVELVQDRAEIRPKTVCLARGDRALALRGGLLHSVAPAPDGHTIDPFFTSVARSRAARHVVGVLLSGMGSDGARGLLHMRRDDLLTLAQDSDSCVVYGMPKVAAELGAVVEVSTPRGIGARVRSLDIGIPDARGRIASGNAHTPSSCAHAAAGSG